MISVSAIVDHLGPSQKSFYLIKEFNKTSHRTDICVSVFFERASIPVTPLMFSCKSIAFLSGYHHVAISTTIANTDMLLKSNNNAKKYFYMWDIEWLTKPSHYSNISKVLLDPKLSIICRSESHEKLLFNFCNKKAVGIVDNWNINQLIDIINRNTQYAAA